MQYYRISVTNRFQIAKCAPTFCLALISSAALFHVVTQNVTCIFTSLIERVFHLNRNKHTFVYFKERS